MSCFCNLPLAADAAGRAAALSERLRGLWEQPHTGLMLRALFVLAFAGAGLYLMIPRGQSRGRRLERYIGAVLTTLSLVLLVTAPISAELAGVEHSQTKALWSIDDQPKVTCWTFYLLATLSLASGVMMITSRNPVYSALWFSMVLLANSGLYLLQGAEFLSAATVIVYAGAIVVTFLFVIMLAQPAGTAKYDRFSREPLLSSVTGLLLAAALVGTLHYSARTEPRGGPPEQSSLPAPATIAGVLAHSGDAVAVSPEKHVSGLGRALFMDHVVSVEVIGVLLLAAVVGAMLIAGHRVDGPGESPQNQPR